MALTGKLIHLSVDLLLVSTVLAGVRRNTGLEFNLDRWSPANTADWHPLAKKYMAKYLSLGESCYDYTVASLGSSKYFERR